MNKSKPFQITQAAVLGAYRKVRQNKGGAGVDEMTLKDLEKDKRNHFYKLWNRMSSGSYMPPPVRLVEIPKKSGGKRPLGIPTLLDRVAQGVVARELNRVLYGVFQEDSYGYRSKKSALEAVGKAKVRSWAYDWVVDVDIKGFFDNIPHEKLMQAVRRHVEKKWVLLYIERWLKAPLQHADGRIEAREQGVPQGSVIGPILSNLYLHYVMDKWLERYPRENKFERYADDAVIHCRSRSTAERLKADLSKRMRECGLELHPVKTKVVYCKDSNRKGKYANVTYDFLGFTFKPRQAQNSKRKESFTNCLPGVSQGSMRAMNEKLKGHPVLHTAGIQLKELAEQLNPVIQGWINYYGNFYKTQLKSFMRRINLKLARWAMSKYKKLRTSRERAMSWLLGVSEREPNLFAHWAFGARPDGWLDNRSGMMREHHVPFCENLGLK